MADLTTLNSAKLQAFIDHDVQTFQDNLRDMRAPGSTPMALFDLANAAQPLAIGQMSGDGDTSGKDVATNMAKAASAIDGVLGRHVVAFADLHRNLGEVITTMLKTQGDNLSTVDSQKFLTAISSYDRDMSGTTTPPGGGAGPGPTGV